MTAPQKSLRLPLEIFGLIALTLDVPSIIRLSQTSKAIRGFLLTSLGLWREISKREAQTAALAPYSLPTTLPLSKLIAFATRPYRILPSPSQNSDGSQISPFEPLSPGTPFRFALRNTEATHPSPAATMELLPGGRWILGVQITQSERFRLMCWDIGNPSCVDGGVYDPVAFIDSKHTATDLIEDYQSSLCVQYNPCTESVTCLIAYVGVTLPPIAPLDEDDNTEEITRTHLEIISLSWPSETSPLFRFITEETYSSSNGDSGQVFSCQLDGDLVCFALDSDPIYFWDWKRSVLQRITQVDIVSSPYVYPIRQTFKNAQYCTACSFLCFESTVPFLRKFGRGVQCPRPHTLL
ncbi:hypothetical protein DL93DRAFT_998892 [Clavulina sp. PMI_390]|nr:hypothetical protein DL93DRAFT_998892 [Clavulina sp. PMI_390]